MTEPRSSPHLLRVDDPPERFAPLIEAARALDLRIGWLDVPIEAPIEAPSPLPASLETAARLGVLRAVAVAGNRSVAVKPLKGAPVLRDLLREHFRGCALVLIRGEAQSDTATLRALEEGWAVTAPGEAARAFTTTALAAALRQARPWGPPLPPAPPKPPPKEKKKRREKRRKVKKEK
jgi:hypothetical protein